MKLTVPCFRAERKTAVVLASYALVCALYLATKWAPHADPIDLSWTTVDGRVPFLPWTIFIYIAHFPFLLGCLLGLRDRENMNRSLVAFASTTVVGLAGYLLVPVIPPERVGARLSGIVGALYRLVYAVDSPPGNCFPSLHAAFALLAAGALGRERSRWAPWLYAAAAVISASTLTTRQHYFADLPPALLIVWGSWRFADRHVRFGFDQTRSLSDLLKNPTARAVIVATCGALFGASYIPGSWGVLAWVGLVPLLWAIEGLGPGEAFLQAWLFATPAYAAAFPSYIATIEHFLSVPRPVAVPLFLFGAALHGLVLAAAAPAARWAAVRLEARRGWRPWVATAAAAVPAVALADAWVPRIIPVRLAYTQAFHTPIIQCVEWCGITGLAALIVAVNAAVYAGLRGRREGRRAWVPLLVMAAVLAANESYGVLRMRTVEAEAARRIAAGRALRVAIVQGSVPVEMVPSYERFKTDVNVHRRMSLESLAGAAADVVVWPETTFDGLLEFGAEGSPPTVDGASFQAAMKARTAVGAPLILNAIGVSGGRTYNMSAMAGPGGEFLGASRKRRPIPFGETMPFGEVFPFLYRLSPRTWRLARGDRPELLDLPGKARLGMMICYEDLFPRDARELAAVGAGLLVNQTNDAWFAGGWFEEQHMLFSTFRAVENRLCMVRAVNTGVSAIVSPSGRVLQSLAPGERGVLRATVALMDSRRGD